MNLNIQIGLKVTGNSVEVFYCGNSGSELNSAHAECLKNNDGSSKFYSVRNPLMSPLQSVQVDTEEHPEIIAANARRKVLGEELAKKLEQQKLARKSKAAPVQPPIPAASPAEPLAPAPAIVADAAVAEQVKDAPEVANPVETVKESPDSPTEESDAAPVRRIRSGRRRG